MKPGNILNILNGITDPQQAIRSLPDEQFRVTVLAVAMMMQTVRDEAIRRGIWDDIKGMKVKASDGSPR